jgi:predicted nucleic acid-binding protein
MTLESLGAARRIYLDANVFIYHLIGHEPFRPVLEALFTRADRGECMLVSSELTLAELLVKPLRDKDVAAASRCRAMLETSPGLVLVPISRQIVLEAAVLRASTALKLPDALHGATSRLAACDALLTNDAQLAGASGLGGVLLSTLVG